MFLVQRNEELTFDTSNRTDEHRTVEEVAARQPKPPLKATAKAKVNLTKLLVLMKVKLTK